LIPRRVRIGPLIAPAPLVPFGNFSNDEHTIKAGLNYRFNLGSAMVARY
jgi:outer membrane immunogenic protein